MADIIELLERRDEAGLALLKELYSDYCYSIIYGLLRSHEQTEEALSDVWLAVWNAIPPARPLRLRAYLAKTARNTALHHLRRETAQKRSAATVLLDELSECIPDPAASPDIDLRLALRDFVEGLEPEDRRVFVRRYWYGETTAAIAAELRTPESRVTGILCRTRKKLKKTLEKEGYHP